jgi:hypothetical protein
MNVLRCGRRADAAHKPLQQPHHMRMLPEARPNI